LKQRPLHNTVQVTGPLGRSASSSGAPQSSPAPRRSCLPPAAWSPPSGASAPACGRPRSPVPALRCAPAAAWVRLPRSFPGAGLQYVLLLSVLFLRFWWLPSWVFVGSGSVAGSSRSDPGLPLFAPGVCFLLSWGFCLGQESVSAGSGLFCSIFCLRWSWGFCSPLGGHGQGFGGGSGSIVALLAGGFLSARFAAICFLVSLLVRSGFRFLGRVCLCYGVAGSGVGVSAGRYSATCFLGAVAALLGWLVAAAGNGGWSGLALLGRALPENLMFQ
jgi:hypothetical protein